VARRVSEAPRRGTAPETAPKARPLGVPREYGRSSQTRSERPAAPERDGAGAQHAYLVQRVADLESSLRLAEERLRQITDTSLDVICQFAPDGVFTFVSKASLEVVGYTPEELVGRHFRDAFGPADVASAATLFERAAQGERVELLALTARHKDGHAVPIEVCAVSLVRDGCVIGVQGVARDVSRRRDAVDGLRLYSERLERLIEEHDSELRSTRERLALQLGRSQEKGRVLREREELLRAAFEQAGIGLALVAPDGRFLRVNATLAEILGAGRDELLERRWQDYTHPDDLAPEIARWSRLCAGGLTTARNERRWVRGDGAVVAARALVSAIRTKDGPPSHLMIATAAIG
jgi:PAS domain S-box-containing protein